jgi:hypothetical protein
MKMPDDKDDALLCAIVPIGPLWTTAPWTVLPEEHEMIRQAQDLQFPPLPRHLVDFEYPAPE